MRYEIVDATMIIPPPDSLERAAVMGAIAQIAKDRVHSAPSGDGETWEWVWEFAPDE